MQKSYDKERKEILDNHARAIRQIQNRVEALDYENKDLLEKKHKYESAIARHTEQVYTTFTCGEALNLNCPQVIEIVFALLFRSKRSLPTMNA